MTDDRDSLLREVDEELRREQMEKLWARYNGVILGAAAAVVLAVGLYKILETRRIAAAEAAGSSYAAAETLSSDKKKPEAEAAFKSIAETGPGGYAALAKLQLAGAQVKAGKTADAVATYDSLAKQSGADDLLKNYAQLQAASLRLSDASYDEIENRLSPLIGDDAPYGKSARELLGLAAYNAKKFAEARKYLEPLLIDPNATQATQDRVKIGMARLAEAEVAANPPAAKAPSANAIAPTPAATPAAPEVKPNAGGAGAEKK